MESLLFSLFLSSNEVESDSILPSIPVAEVSGSTCSVLSASSASSPRSLERFVPSPQLKVIAAPAIIKVHMSFFIFLDLVEHVFVASHYGGEVYVIKKNYYANQPLYGWCALKVVESEELTAPGMDALEATQMRMKSNDNFIRER
jgi:hypothetical protein